MTKKALAELAALRAENEDLKREVETFRQGSFIKEMEKGAIHCFVRYVQRRDSRPALHKGDLPALAEEYFKNIYE